MKHKLVHIATVFALAGMAYLQLNDPDPLYWVSVYLVAALIPVARLVGKSDRQLWWVCSGLIMAGLLISAQGFMQFILHEPLSGITGTMAADSNVEAAREFLGLAIAWGMLFICRQF